MAVKKASPSGPASLFRGKVRKPVTLTLTPAHHEKVKRNTVRLGITRADLIGLLIEKYADTVKKPAVEYRRLTEAVEALGGSLQYESWNGPLGGAWVLTLGRRRLRMTSKRSPLLDACYSSKDATVVPGPLGEEIDPAGMAQLLTLLASSEDAEAG